MSPGKREEYALQLKPHAVIYRRLSDITTEVRSALVENDDKELARLAKEHESIINDLKQAGLSNDPQMFDLIKEVKDVVNELVIEIEKKRDKAGRELKRIVNGKKLVAAYGR